MKTPIVYQISHFILGAIGTKYNWVIFIFIIYQFLQLYFGIRFFLLDVQLCTLDFSKSFKTGNSLEHTSKKILDFFIGYVITKYFMKYLYMKL
jgi:hypothetical protein